MFIDYTDKVYCTQTEFRKIAVLFCLGASSEWNRTMEGSYAILPKLLMSRRQEVFDFQRLGELLRYVKPGAEQDEKRQVQAARIFLRCSDLR